jgi:hypothetical protein
MANGPHSQKMRILNAKIDFATCIQCNGAERKGKLQLKLRKPPYPVRLIATKVFAILGMP